MAGSTSARTEITALSSELNSLDHIELGAKLGAVAIALTYITGYLTTSTYLAGYGIHTDSSEFFRAKYLYVGFHFWLFTTLLIVLLTLGWRMYKWLMSSRLGDRQRPLAVTLNDALDAQRHPLDPQQEGDAGKARWSIVVSQLLFILLFEIMFSHPDAFRRYGSLRVAWLFHVLLFQFHRYAILTPYFHTANRFIRKPLYLWGSVYGRRWHITDWVPWYSLVMMVVLGFCLIGHDIVSPLIVTHYRVYRTLYVFSMVCDLACLALLAVGAQAYCYFDRRERHNLWIECKRRTPRLYVLLPAAIICLPVLTASYELFELQWSWRHYYIRLYYFLGYVVLLMNLMIIGNIWLFTKRRIRRDRERPAGPDEPQKTPDELLIDKWQAWILRAAAVTVLYIVSVLGFTRLVYPFIPADKAGGDYSGDTKTVSVAMMVGSPIGICTSIPGNESYVLLEENGSWVYLGSGTPDAWGRITRDGTIGRPNTIYSVNRNCIAFMNSFK